MIFWRSLAFNITYTLWTGLIGLALIPLMCRHSWAVKAGRPWAKGVLFLARICCGIRTRVEGAEFIAKTPALYASKHQSAWDTVIFHLLLDAPCFVMKRELLHLPIFGWHLKSMGMVAIDRKAGAASLKHLLRESERVLQKEARPLVIFPEGTRKAEGSAPAYLPGITALYHHASVPVVPVALNSGRYWGRDAFRKKPGTIVIRFLPPIMPGLPKKEFAPLLESTLEKACSAL